MKLSKNGYFAKNLQLPYGVSPQVPGAPALSRRDGGGALGGRGRGAPEEARPRGRPAPDHGLRGAPGAKRVCQTKTVVMKS